MVKKDGKIINNKFRLNYFRNWQIVTINYYNNSFIINITKRLFWYNFEVIRRLVARAFKKKIKLRYKKKKKKKKIKIWKIYVRKKKKKKFLWISGILWVPLNIKSKGSRMGHGKGSLKGWYISFNPGIIVFKLYNFKIILLNIISRQILSYMKVSKIINILQIRNYYYSIWYW